MYLLFNVHLFNNPHILLCSHCMYFVHDILFNFIYISYLDIHRSPPVAHTDWCAERTKSAPTNAHLQVRTKSAPTGAHQKRTYRCTPKAHLQVRTKSAPTPHLHICTRTCEERTYRCAPKAHLQVRTKSAPVGAHQKRTCRCTPKAHLQVRSRCTPKVHLPLIYIFAPAPKAHLLMYKCMKNSEDSTPNTHLYERTYWVGAQHT